jgi:hypothetical protein
LHPAATASIYASNNLIPKPYSIISEDINSSNISRTAYVKQNNTSSNEKAVRLFRTTFTDRISGKVATSWALRPRRIRK